jgi:hypothetical protein
LTILKEERTDLQSRPLVSVLTSVYNGEKYLSECIESVLAIRNSDKTHYANSLGLIMTDSQRLKGLDMLLTSSLHFWHEWEGDSALPSGAYEKEREVFDEDVIDSQRKQRPNPFVHVLPDTSGWCRSGCSFAFEEIGKLREGREGSLRLTARLRVDCPVTDLIALMFIVVTVEAEQLPVAAVGRIIVMVVVLVMDRELAQFLPVEFASAVGTDPRE